MVYAVIDTNVIVAALLTDLHLLLDILHQNPSVYANA